MLALGAWIVTFATLILGSVTADGRFGDVSIGPPYAVVVLLSYPFYLYAQLKTWPFDAFLSLSGAIFFAWWLVPLLGVLEALTVAPVIGLFLVALILVACVIVPLIACKRRRDLASRPVQGAPESTGRRIAAAASVVLFFVMLLLSLPVWMGLSIAAAEFVQANAFRDFCKSRVNTLTEKQIRAYMPERFISQVGGTKQIAILSHGRGCVVDTSSGSPVVVRLIPRSGFPWMISGVPRAKLKGAFE